MLAPTTLALLALSTAALAKPGHDDQQPHQRVRRQASSVATGTATTHHTASAHSATITVSATKSVANLAAVSALPLTAYTYSYADIPYQVRLVLLYLCRLDTGAKEPS